MTTKEKINQIFDNAKQDVLDLLDKGEPTLTATRKDNHILVGTKNFDFSEVQFQIAGGKTHSLRWMQENGYTDAEIEDNTFRVGNPSNINEAWKITVGKGQWIQEGVPKDGYFNFSKKLTTELSKIAPYKVGFWDAINAPKIFDWYKGYAEEVNKMKGYGKQIPIISGFEPDMSDAKIKEKLVSKMRKIDSDVDIEFVILHDEPFLKGFSNDHVNRIVGIAMTEYPNIKFGFSISDNGILNYSGGSDLEMVIPINTYLFFYEQYDAPFVTTKQKFFIECDKVFNRAKELYPNSEFVFVAQGFYINDHKYRKPPVDSVGWTYEYASKNNLKGVLWYEWRDRTGVGVQSMPELYEKIKISHT